MNKNEMIRIVEDMIAAPSCCQEMKDAGDGNGSMRSAPQGKTPPGMPCAKKQKRISARSTMPLLFLNRRKVPGF